jgi:DNA invertase Pin-like site-specific DNA recombinase
MITLEGEQTKVSTEHRAKLAYVYVRQSSVSQVNHHIESTDLQYRLVERAVRLGWAREQVRTIDDDLGKSGASAEERLGFQHLLAEIGLAKVGLVISLDASRLARNNGDWYQLLELCSLFGTLIADSERLYDPRAYHDRLLLGLSGMMSEAELHQLKLRLHAGEWHKAERGELPLPLPAGFVRTRDGEVLLNPDEEVQARIHLIFAKFRELGTAKAVVRYLRQHQLPVPTRPLLGPAPQEVLWRPATSSRVHGILKTPAYAGVYVYGRSTHAPERRKPGRPSTGIIRLPIDKWPIVLHNRHPAYVTWEEFLAIQNQLINNQPHYRTGKTGAPRKGLALLQGIAICGRCGARMRLRYSGEHGEFPVYACSYAHSQMGEPRCQEVRALGIDAEVERILLAALAPDRLAIALAALEHLEAEDAALRKQWDLRRERARYEAERARRQYDAVEPENRLVARSLERLWEEKLRAVEQIEQEFQGWLRQHQVVVSAEDRQDILALGADLPALWSAATTTPADRKQILRLLIESVLLDQHRAHGKVWFQINWQTGAISEHWLVRRVRSYRDYAHLDLVQQRIRELNAEQRMDDEIAAALNEEGLRTARGEVFTGPLVWLLRKKWGIAAIRVKATPIHPLRWDDGTYSVHGAAATIGVYLGTIYHWLLHGRLHGVQLAKGMPWQIPLTDDQIEDLRAYAAQARPSRRKAK